VIPASASSSCLSRSPALAVALPLLMIESVLRPRLHVGARRDLGVLEHGQRNYEIGYAIREQTAQTLGIAPDVIRQNDIVKPNARFQLADDRHARRNNTPA